MMTIRERVIMLDRLYLRADAAFAKWCQTLANKDRRKYTTARRWYDRLKAQPMPREL